MLLCASDIDYSTTCLQTGIFYSTNVFARADQFLNENVTLCHMFSQSMSKPNKRILLFNSRMWDKFTMMQRDQQVQDDTFRPMFRVFKIIVYVILFCCVLGTAVINKICLLIMTTSIPKVNERFVFHGATHAMRHAL